MLVSRFTDNINCRCAVESWFKEVNGLKLIKKNWWGCYCFSFPYYTNHNKGYLTSCMALKHGVGEPIKSIPRDHYATRSLNLRGLSQWSLTSTCRSSWLLHFIVFSVVLFVIIIGDHKGARIPNMDTTYTWKGHFSASGWHCYFLWASAVGMCRLCRE